MHSTPCGNSYSLKLKACWISAGFLLLCIGFTSIQASAQSFFYIEYKIPDAQQQVQGYFAFLTVYPDGNATARVRYQDMNSQEDYLYELSLSDSLLPASGQAENETKHLIPNRKVRIMGAESEMPAPVFVFEKIKEGEIYYYTPTGVRYESNGQWVSANLTDKSVFSFPQLSKEFVSAFYNEEEPYFRDLFKLDTRSLTATDKNTKLFLLIVANTDDKKIGKTCMQDMFNVSATFTDLAERLGITIIRRSIWGRGFSKKAVDDSINALKPGPNDIVVFYYSGHGYRLPTDKSKFPNMVLSNDYTMSTLVSLSLNMEDVYNRIVKKGARLNLVLSDCCNERVDAPIPVGREILATKSAGLPLSVENCKALFFSPKRTSILATAADINQLASGNPNVGGFFSWHFKASLESHTSRMKSNVTWLQLLNTARVNTAHQALTARCGAEKARCQQHAWFMIK